MDILLSAVQYNIHQWDLCGDMKVDAINMQGGINKHCCFLSITPPCYTQLHEDLC